MNNLNDYIIWRGELAFSRETFSPIDMLIFSQLVYTPLENINPSDYGKTLRELYPSVYPNGAPGGSTFTNEDLFGLWKHVARSVRFGEARLEKFVSKFDASAEMQFAAATFSYRGTYIVAFRGTDTSVIGWKEDFNMGYESPIPSQKEAVAYINSMGFHFNDLFLCGHSKGGNLAMYGGAFCRHPRKVTGIYSFDGPGFDDEVLATKEWEAVEDRIFSFIPESSVVGLLLGYYRKYTIVKSDNVGVLQHNPFFWHVCGGHFVEAQETSFSSRLFSETMHRFLESCPKKQRRVLIETAFNIIEASRATNAQDIIPGFIKYFGDVKQIVQSVPKEDRQALSEMGKIFADAGSTSLKQLLSRF